MNSNLPKSAAAWRPRYHYTPQCNWMNDPNGLVYFDGEYHLYYQYNPHGSDWGHISWGHAVSTDLASWQELPVAIPATERAMAFSGSVVVDHGNCGGFAPPDASAPALVAFFTGFDPDTKIQSQHLAYSLDRGRSYTPYAGNPIIDIGSTEFRDPKVFWHAPTRHWVMLVVVALEQQVWFYTSANLIDWTRVSTFGPAGSADKNIWEVPELFELPIDGDSTKKRWVLIVSVNHGSLWGGSGVQYFIGDFDGKHFKADASDGQLTLWADHGRDFYAPITFANLPDERVLWLGWASNWAYARELPTEPWRGQQSGVRELGLAATSQGLRLRQRMAREMLALVEPEPLLKLRGLPACQAGEALSQASLVGRQLMARLVVSTRGLIDPIGLEFFKGGDDSVRIGFDPSLNGFFIDRRCRAPLFEGQSERHDARRLLDAPDIELEVWIDGSLLELLADGGTVALTDLVYADPQATSVCLFHGGEAAMVQSLDLHQVRAAMYSSNEES
ncbi:MAG TPA: glycoside hydrolase family 32 protein [Ideonella sp.]|uniref:glycoside hydrolase family 32 protein n=1 Tax=Ideonella sp. TaxID=1929293 RepID=UPI002D07A0A3|nr:glycoside hydrolase family 32 protein [Ideonella sp.]HSI47934.1 glycoside hydrolase family 32 protein [Ideonella sp.]